MPDESFLFLRKQIKGEELNECRISYSLFAFYSPPPPPPLRLYADIIVYSTFFYFDF